MFHNPLGLHSPRAVLYNAMALLTAQPLLHLHPWWCDTALPAMKKGLESTSMGSPGLPFFPPPRMSLPAAHHYFSGFLTAFQAAGGRTAGKRSGNGEQGLDRVIQNPEGGKRLCADAHTGHVYPCSLLCIWYSIFTMMLWGELIWVVQTTLMGSEFVTRVTRCRFVCNAANLPRMAVECPGEQCLWVCRPRRWGDISSLGPSESSPPPPHCCVALAHHRPGGFWLW